MAEDIQIVPTEPLADLSKPIGVNREVLDFPLCEQMKSNSEFTLSLPSVEEMKRDVAKASCELQQAFLAEHRPISSKEHSCIEKSTSVSLPGVMTSYTDETFENTSSITHDPLQHKREETVFEEIIINGKRYRHTYTKRTVLELQKTRQVFILPASPKSEMTLPEESEYTRHSSNCQINNKNDVQLDLSAKNQGEESGAMFDSPAKSFATTDDEIVLSRSSDQEIMLRPENGLGRMPNAPLVVSHMYHFGYWDKGAPILDPRLPARLNLPRGHPGLEETVFRLTPDEWHQSEISYTGNMSQVGGTTAKGRIVACLQRFTQRSEQTGKQLFRSTYVQHTKIARWRISDRIDETHEQMRAIKPASLELSNNTSEGVSDTGKLDDLTPLDSAKKATIDSPHPLIHPCSYDRLQLLQAVCPAAAASVLILGGRMPELRGKQDCQRPNGIDPHGNVTVSANVWCPHPLLLTEPTDDLIRFSTPMTTDKESSSTENPNCLLLGGTLDGLLVYALKVFKQSKSDAFETLIPDIFMRLYPTFTVIDEVVSRLIQRFLAFAPIEPGGLGCLSEPPNVWDEAGNALRFLRKMLSLSERRAFSPQLGHQITSFAKLLKEDAKALLKDSAALEHDSNPLKTGKEEQAISDELNKTSDWLSEFVQKFLDCQFDRQTLRADIVQTGKIGNLSSSCTCCEKLHNFSAFAVRDLAEQITLIEEAYFNNICLSELIDIKNLEKGNTPTLFRCVQHFNSLNSIVRCLTLIARDLDQTCPSRVQMTGNCDFQAHTGKSNGEGDLQCPCKTCGRNREESSRTFCSVRQGTNLRRRHLNIPMLTSSRASAYVSKRNRRNNSILESTLRKLCALAEELKKMSNFSSFLAVILGLQNAPTTTNVSKKVMQKLNDFGAYMSPPSFAAYRRDLEAAKMPCLPYLGLVFQQLIHLDSGNLLFQPKQPKGEAFSKASLSGSGGDEVDADRVVNFWRCWKHYLILGYFIKRADADMLEEGGGKSYGFQPNQEIQAFLNSFDNSSPNLPQLAISKH